MYRSVVQGCGSYLPEKVVTNEDLAKIVDTSDEWIVSRSGIRRRHFAADGQLTSDLAAEAGRNALKSAGLNGLDLDILIVATTTPDETFPATATKVQAALGMDRGAAFDVQAACSGFIYGLSIADNFIKSGQAKRALVIGAETMSRLLDYSDRATCVLFGDGAGAIVLTAEEGVASKETPGVLSTHLHSDGRQHDLLYANGGVSTTGTSGSIVMAGKEVFRHAVNNLASVVDEALEYNGLHSSDIDWVVPHQANQRIIEGTARKLNLSMDKIVLTIEDHGNTSAASVPLALDRGVRDQRIKSGDMVLVEAMGGGFTWGAGVIHW